MSNIERRWYAGETQQRSQSLNIDENGWVGSPDKGWWKPSPGSMVTVDESKFRGPSTDAASRWYEAKN
jgi:hypothetical protein